MSKFNENNGVLIQGHIKIHDLNQALFPSINAMQSHYENMSIALAESVANPGQGFINQWRLVTAEQVLIPTGIITYLIQQYWHKCKSV